METGRTTYAEMSSMTFSNPNYDFFTAPDFGFYQISPRGMLNQPDFQQQMGDFKFHMSIHPDDVEAAWNIASEILMDPSQSVPSIAKVTKPETALSFANPDSIQAGKMITVYTIQDVPPEHYAQLMQELEERLQQAGIRPGPTSNADRVVPGGQYTSYRVEKGPNGEYMASSELGQLPREQRYNPYNIQDPYANMNLSAAPTPRVSPTPPNSNSPVQDFLQKIPDDRLHSTNKGLYIDVRGVDERTISYLQESLGQSGIAYEVKHSSAIGGNVIAIADAQDIVDFNNIRSGQVVNIPRSAPAAPSIDEVNWLDVQKNGISGMEVNVESWSESQRQQFVADLNARGVSANVVPSSVQNGQSVVRVMGEDNVNALRGSPPLNPRQEAHQFVKSIDESDLVSTNKGLYLDMTNAGPAELSRASSALNDLGVSHEIKHSNAMGGNVIAIANGDDIVAFNNIRNTEIGANVGRAEAPQHGDAMNGGMVDSPPAGRTFGQKALAALSVGGKMLGVVGALTVGLEVAGLTGKAHAAMADEQISAEAFATYEGLMAAHVAQGTLDPTLLGGEIVIQAAYDEWVEQFDVPPELVATLKPSSIADFFEGNPKSAEQLEFEVTYQTVMALDEEQLATMPPEVQALAEMGKQVEQAEYEYDHWTSGVDNFITQGMQEKAEAEARMYGSQERYEEYFYELREDPERWQETKAALSEGLSEKITEQPETSMAEISNDSAVAATTPSSSVAEQQLSHPGQG